MRAMPPFFMKSNFARNVFWEFAFVSLSKTSETFLAPALPGKTVIIWLAVAMDIVVSP